MEDIKRFANDILKNQLEEGEKILISEVEPGVYYASICTNRRGTGSVIIGKDLSFLWGSSAISYSKLLELYKKGERTKHNIEKYNTTIENNLPAEDQTAILHNISKLYGISKEEIQKDKGLEGNLTQEEVDLLNKNSRLPINLLSNDARILEMQQIEGLSSFRNIMSCEYHCKDFLIEFSGYPTDENIYRATNFHLYTNKYDFIGIRVGITKEEDAIAILSKYNFETAKGERLINYSNDKVFNRKNCKVAMSFRDNIVNRLDISMETKYLGNRLY